MKHRAMTLDGQLIIGWYVQNFYGTLQHYIIKDRVSHEIIPETLSVESMKPDCKGDMIFMSIELDGVMTKGGDNVIAQWWDNKDNRSVFYSTANSRAEITYGLNSSDSFPLGDMSSRDLTIVGKQF